ncbi:MAG: hypothetical protein ACI311_02500 [Bacilli bacterium]
MKRNLGRFFVLLGFMIFYIAYFLDYFKDEDHFYRSETLMTYIFPIILALSFSKIKCLNILGYSFASMYSLVRLFYIFDFYSLYFEVVLLIISCSLLLLSSLVYLIESILISHLNTLEQKRNKKLKILAPSKLMLYKELLDSKTLSKDEYEKVKTNFINSKKINNNIENDINLIKEWKSLLDLKLINDEEFKIQKEKILFGEKKNLQQ